MWIFNLDVFGPFITDLKRITVSSTKITDASVILGFAYCHQLTSIKMGRPVVDFKDYLDSVRCC